MRTLVALPVYNEAKYIDRVLPRVLERSEDVLVVDDGSTDATPCLLSGHPVDVIRHARNRGYGRSLQDAFRWAAVGYYDWIVTMDCDEQHEPEAIPRFLALAETGAYDIVSGSRYLPGSGGDADPPANRRAINAAITREINKRLGLTLTDAFCGFKAYRVEAISRLDLDVDGYAFPLQLWVYAAAAGLRMTELPVRLIYNDPDRTFGGPLDNDDIRMDHYRRVLHCAIERCADRLPEPASDALIAGSCG